MTPALTASEAAIYESLVVKRYLQPFGEAAVAMLIQHPGARVALFGCRTGYPAELVMRRLPGCALHGVDASAAAIAIARTKAKLAGLANVQYDVGKPLPEGAFTHALLLHPLSDGGDYQPVLSALGRLLAPGGQAVVALPLRGSFPEIYDMLREYALRNDEREFGEKVEREAARRPNPETLAEQVESAGFGEVEVAVDLVGVAFANGRDFLEDPITRLVVGPDIVASLGGASASDAALTYATDAIAKYWSEIAFELTVNVGTVSARRL